MKKRNTDTAARTRHPTASQVFQVLNQVTKFSNQVAVVAMDVTAVETDVFEVSDMVTPYMFQVFILYNYWHMNDDSYYFNSSETRKISLWRHVMGWIYGAVIILDFIVFPILWNVMQVYEKVPVLTQWAPITLSNGGLFHLAMGAILGVTAWTGSRERMLQMTSDAFGANVANASVTTTTTTTV
jgi:hypothetical protein